MFPHTALAADASPRQSPIATLDSIQESFLTYNFNIEPIRDWLLGMGVVILVILVIMLFKTIQARRARYNPFGNITDSKAIRTVLLSAFEQRRTFEIQFHTEAKQRRPTLRCAPEHFGRDSFTVEINGLKALSNKWLMRPATVFFRIQAGRDFTFYTFDSHITNIHSPRQGICHLTLAIPAALENRQKRSFLRITPPNELLLGSAIWCDTTMPKGADLNDITAWPRPKLLLLPGRVEQFHLLDLSAGGARISIPNAVMHTLNLRFAATEYMILMVDLLDPEQNKRVRLWMQCRVQSAWVEHATRNMHMGVQFTSWGRPKDTTADPFGTDAASIDWLRLSSVNEVEALGNWIIRRHLELFREKPAEEE